MNEIYTDFGTAYPRSVGRPVQNITPTNGGVYLKFAGTEGGWKGFSANVGVTHMSSTPTEAPNAGDPPAGANGIQPGTSTNQWMLRVPSFTLWNVGVSYEWVQSARVKHTVRLNVNNVFDEDYLKVNKNIGDPRGIYFTYDLRFSH